MKNENQIIGLLLGLFLIAVVYNGNAKKLTSIILAQVGFIKWVIALLLLGLIASSTKSKVVHDFIFIGLVAMMITVAGNGQLQTAAQQIDGFF